MAPSFSPAAVGFMLALGFLVGCSEGVPAVEPPLPVNPPPDEPTVLDPLGPRDPALVARAAVFLGSCVPISRLYSVEGLLYESYYIDDFDLPFRIALQRTTDCFAGKANGCKAVDECAGITPEPIETCTTQCAAGDVYVLCGDSIGYRHRCQKLGLTCTLPGGCIKPPEPCEPGIVDPCKNGAPHLCWSDNTYVDTPICADYGLVCDIHPTEGYPICRGDGTACLGGWGYVFEEVRFEPLSGCDGSTMRQCASDYEQVMDCGALAKGFTCQNGNLGRYCGLGSECDHYHKTTCEGDSIVFCNAGRIEKIDCNTLGFTGCDPTYGVCTPSPAGLF